MIGVGLAALVALGTVAQAPASQIDQGTPLLLTSVLAAAASANASFDVVATEDLRRALEVEGERRATGCEDIGSTSCLSEVAQALGASLVLHSELGRLGDELFFTISLFDSSTGTSGGRRVVRAKTSPELASAGDVATKELLSGFLAQHPPAAGTRIRLLVLDAKLRGDAPAAAPVAQEAPPAETPWLLVGAGAAGLTGGAAVVVAVLLDGVARDSRLKANDVDTSQKETQRQIDQSWAAGGAAIGLYALGPVLLVGAAVLAGIHVFGGSE